MDDVRVKAELLDHYSERDRPHSVPPGRWQLSFVLTAPAAASVVVQAVVVVGTVGNERQTPSTCQLLGVLRIASGTLWCLVNIDVDATHKCRGQRRG